MAPLDNVRLLCISLKLIVFLKVLGLRSFLSLFEELERSDVLPAQLTGREDNAMTDSRDVYTELGQHALCQ